MPTINDFDNIMEDMMSSVYRLYVTQRVNCPWRSPEHWEGVFGEKAREYEKLYQTEKEFERRRV